MYRLERGDKKSCIALHTLTFPLDEWEGATAYWIAYDDVSSPVGFCSARVLRNEPGVFLTRAGVLPAARGQGLQRRMITTRCNWTRKRGFEYAITYCSFDNHPSIVNLLRCGFHFTRPIYPYGGKAVHYFIRYLT